MDIEEEYKYGIFLFLCGYYWYSLTPLSPLKLAAFESLLSINSLGI